MKNVLIFTAILAATPSFAISQQTRGLVPVFNQPLEGVYSQNWSAHILGDRGIGIELYVVGEGKLGDFFAVISVDCVNPLYSQWLATGGTLTTSDVPSDAIVSSRRLVC